MEGNENVGNQAGKLSGVERGEINASKLKNYLDHLRQTGQNLPTENGKPNRTAIAEEAAISRNSLYVNKACKRLLNEFLGISDDSISEEDRIGTRAESQIAQVELLERRLSRTEQQLANCMAEKEELRGRLIEAEANLARFQYIEDNVIKEGRRVIL